MSFGENLKRIRREKGLTQKQLAVKASVAHSAIGYYEQGRKISPTYSTIESLAEALDCTMADLLGAQTSTETPEETAEIEITVKINGKQVMFWTNKEI